MPTFTEDPESLPLFSVQYAIAAQYTTPRPGQYARGGEPVWRLLATPIRAHSAADAALRAKDAGLIPGRAIRILATEIEEVAA